MTSDENQAIATLQAERMRAFFIANGFPQPLTCPFCGTDQVRREDPHYREFQRRRGKNGWQMSVCLPKGKSMADLRAVILPIDPVTDWTPPKGDNPGQSALRMIVRYGCVQGHRWRMSLRSTDDAVWLHEQWDADDPDGVA